MCCFVLLTIGLIVVIALAPTSASALPLFWMDACAHLHCVNGTILQCTLCHLQWSKLCCFYNNPTELPSLCCLVLLQWAWPKHHPAWCMPDRLHLLPSLGKSNLYKQPMWQHWFQLIAKPHSWRMHHCILQLLWPQWERSREQPRPNWCLTKRKRAKKSRRDLTSSCRHYFVVYPPNACSSSFLPAMQRLLLNCFVVDPWALLLGLRQAGENATIDWSKTRANQT